MEIVNQIVNERWELYVRLLVAMIMGSIIGYERTVKNKDAGIRTHTLVCLGACAVMILSGFSDGQFRDPMRLAAQVISGIGFIGAGIIWMDKNNVTRGLTTAANVWVTSGLGLMVGFGLYDLAIVLMVCMLVSLNLPRILKKLGVKINNDSDN